MGCLFGPLVLGLSSQKRALRDHIDVFRRGGGLNFNISHLFLKSSRRVGKGKGS